MPEGKVARVTHIIASSPKGFEDAIQVGFRRAIKTLRGITNLRVKNFEVVVEGDRIVEYRVEMEVVFLLED